MSETDEASRSPAAPQTSPEVTALLLATFADLYRQEVGAEEDVHRTLPFFGTALGIVIASLAYAAGRLPKWSDLPVVWGHNVVTAAVGLPYVPTDGGQYAFFTAVCLLFLAVIEAGCVLVWISYAVVLRKYERIGPEANLRARLVALHDYYDEQGITGDIRDKELLEDVRQMLLDSYTTTTPLNRHVNQERYKYRARASLHLVRSLIWALGATSVIFMVDKLGCFPRVIP
jgi:hypothetical protein